MRALSTPGRRVIYRVRNGQARPRILPLPPSLIRDNRPDYSSMSVDDQYRYQALILSKYNALREGHPWLNIPPLDHSLTLDQKHDQYVIYHREVSIRASVNKYKSYLALGFRLFELFCTGFLGLRVLTGYSENEIANFDLYEGYLREMAERNYEVTNSQWPLEVRLIVTAVIQAALFAVVSWIGSRLGTSNVGPIVNSIMGIFKRPAAAEPQASNGLPDPPQPDRFDLGSILNMAQAFMGGIARPTDPRPPAPRRPAFTE